MSSFSQFYILSSRGDTIISKNYRGDVPKNSSELFFRKIKLWKGDAPPVIDIDGTNFLYIKKNSLLFVVVTRFNVSPSLILEILERISRVFKDYCGVLTEESIRKNFVLLYELLDEMVDYGLPQTTSTELLKMYVHNEPVHVDSARTTGVSLFNSKKTISSAAVQRPISLSLSEGKKNEIYVDIVERLNVLFDTKGYVRNSTIDGAIQMKSYLSGNPGLRIALNEDLIIGKNNSTGYSHGRLILDDCNFHDCVNLDDFEAGRTLALVPPDGEFTVMNYRITSEFRTPFRIETLFDQTDSTRCELMIRIRADIPEKNHGTNVVVSIPLPKITAAARIDLGNDVLPSSATSSVASVIGGSAPVTGQTADYDDKEKKINWLIKKFPGGSQLSLRVKISLTQNANIRREVGPISMSFEIPAYNTSGLNVKYLKVADTYKDNKPHRWVRYATTSNSYVARM